MEGLYLAMGAGVLALLFAVFLGRRVLVNEEGTLLMQEIGAAIQEGANAFLKREYTVLAFFVIIIAGILLALGLTRDEQDPSVAYAYLVGAISSALAGFIGMRIAVKANMRTAAAARTSLNKALRIAFSSGGVMGITVVGIGILGASILWIVFEDPAIVAGFSFGASSIALFARVGGGIYTKAADVGGDLAGKVEAASLRTTPATPLSSRTTSATTSATSRGWAPTSSNRTSARSSRRWPSRPRPRSTAGRLSATALPSCCPS